MIRRSDITVFADGTTPEPGVYVTVKDDTGALATLYDDAAALKANPFITGVGGAFSYNIADGDAGAFTEEYRLSLSDSPKTIRAVSLTTEEPLDGTLTPELFAAAGDGVTNDTTAFQLLAAAINAAGGGVVAFRPGATYIVGQQTLVNDSLYMWKGQPILVIDGLTKPFELRGNGAKLKIAPGLKFGTFNAAGAPTVGGLRADYSNITLEAAVTIKNCTGHVSAHDFEIDGSDAAQTIGGQFGDTGWQIEADGFWLWNNTGGEDVSGVYSHHHLRDGSIILGGPTTTEATSMQGSIIRGVRSEYNGRQGLSFIGGKGYTFTGCKFNKTGRGVLYSAPGAGVDLEAEIGLIRDIHFIGCEFADNTGVQCLADSGDIKLVRWDKCRFIGTYSWAHWIVKPYLSFHDCTFAGCINFSPAHILTEPSANPPLALPKFYRCAFTDDYAFSSAGTLVAIGRILGSAATDLSYTLFEGCHFRAGYNIAFADTGGGQFRDCSFDLGTIVSAFLSPNFYGNTTYAEASDQGLFAFFNFSVLSGIITYNGARVRKATATYDPASLADGARATTNIAVPWARRGKDALKVTFSLDLQGVNLRAYVASDNNATAVFENETGGVVDLGSGTITVSAVDVDV